MKAPLLIGFTPEQKRLRRKEQQLAWRRAHPERVRLYSITNYAKPEVRERMKENTRLWHLKNKDHDKERRKAFLDGLTPEELREKKDRANEASKVRYRVRKEAAEALKLERARSAMAELRIYFCGREKSKPWRLIAQPS